MGNISLFVPGRLCLLGEHGDWASKYIHDDYVGSTLVTGIDQGIYATATKIDQKDAFIFETNMIVGNVKFPTINIKSLDEMRRHMKFNEFISYVSGTAYYIFKNYDVCGIHLTIISQTLPIKKGLSSSAAICILVAKAFNEVYELGLDNKTLMDIAYNGEVNAGSECGKLDQLCVFGKKITNAFFHKGEITRTETIDCGNKIYMVFADLNAFKDTKKILIDLQNVFKSPEYAKSYLMERYFVFNDTNVVCAKESISKGDAYELGYILSESQEEFNRFVRPYSIHLESPVLDHVLSDDYIHDLTYGGKGVGSHGDGSVQFVAKDEDSQKILCNYLVNRLGMIAYPFTLE